MERGSLGERTRKRSPSVERFKVRIQRTMPTPMEYTATPILLKIVTPAATPMPSSEPELHEQSQQPSHEQQQQPPHNISEAETPSESEEDASRKTRKRRERSTSTKSTSVGIAATREKRHTKSPSRLHHN